MTEYSNDIPKTLKMVMMFIDRVGFPILAFVLMFYMSLSSIAKMTNALETNTKALIEFSMRTEQFQKVVAIDHSEMKTDVRKLLENERK